MNKGKSVITFLGFSVLVFIGFAAGSLVGYQGVEGQKLKAERDVVKSLSALLAETQGLLNTSESQLNATAEKSRMLESKVDEYVNALWSVQDDKGFAWVLDGATGIKLFNRNDIEPRQIRLSNSPEGVEVSVKEREPQFGYSYNGTSKCCWNSRAQAFAEFLKRAKLTVESLDVCSTRGDYRVVVLSDNPRLLRVDKCDVWFDGGSAWQKVAQGANVTVEGDR